MDQRDAINAICSILERTSRWGRTVTYTEAPSIVEGLLRSESAYVAMRWREEYEAMVTQHLLRCQEIASLHKKIAEWAKWRAVYQREGMMVGDSYGYAIDALLEIAEGAK